MQIVELKSCELKKLLVIIALLPTSMLFVGVATGAPTNVSSCQAITSPGEYVLNQSIVNSSDPTCISINASDVIFDGAGYAIDGMDNASSYGVYVYNSTNMLTNVTVKNLTITDWDTAIRYSNATYGTIGNNLIDSNIEGIFLSLSSNNNNLNNNTVTSNKYGIYIANSNNNTLINNNVSLNGEGIELYFSRNNTLTDNIADSNTNYGIILTTYSSNNTLINNTANLNYDGIYLYDSSNNNTLTTNVINYNTKYGISSWSSDYNVLSNNTASSNSVAGIYFSSSSNNNVTNNKANLNIDYGIYFYNSSNNILSNNSAISNIGTGIYFDSSNNNTLISNNLGINYNGIFLGSSNYNTLINNTANSNNNGIYFSYSSSNILSNNTVLTSISGLSLEYSSNNTLTNNNMTGNSYNFYLTGSQESDFNNSIDTTNTVDSMPIFYLKNVSNTIFNSSTNTATFYCILCNNVTIKDFTLTKNGFGIFFWNTNNSKIENVTVSLTRNTGIRLESSNNNILTNSNISTNSGYGIHIGSSTNNTLANNTVSFNVDYGISIVSSGNNTLSNNTANSNSIGIAIGSSNGSILTSNNVNLNSNAGIYLANSNDSGLSNNIANSNSIYGILIKLSTNNTVSNITANLNMFGLVLDRVDSHILSDSTINSNSIDGIELLSSTNNTFKNNFASNNILWDFYSAFSSVNNTVINLSLDPTISFTGKDVSIKSASVPASDPNDYKNISKYINATNNSADSWLFLNVSYSDSDVSNLNESSLRMWKHNGSSWSQVSGTNSVETAQNYVYANITSFSIFALLGEPISTPPTSPGGGGGGGGGGSSGENYTNIESKEKYDLHIYKDNVTSYRFVNSDPILFVNITGNVNAGEITVLVEVLRNTSTLVKVSAPGTVYKNVNIWVEASGFAVPRSIKGALVTFRVKNSWLAENNIQEDEIFLLNWAGNIWSKLETKVISKDDKYTYFESLTDSFPNFAISGIKSAAVTASIPVPATMTAAETSTPTATSPQPAENMEWAFALIGFIGSATATYYFVIKKQL